MARRNARRGQHQIQPSQVKKRSRSTTITGNNLKVSGARELTNTGYLVPGFQGKSFETYYEVMLPGTATDVLLHPKKDKTVWIISGDGFVTLESPVGTGQVTRRLVAGDNIAFPRGCKYRITTTGDSRVEMLVTQQAKYAASLEVVEDTGSFVEASAEDLREPTRRERLGDSTTATNVPRRPRGQSKAALQQQIQNSHRPIVKPTNGLGQPRKATGNPQTLGFSTDGVNAQPVDFRQLEAG